MKRLTSFPGKRMWPSLCAMLWPQLKWEKVFVDEACKEMDVVVPDNQLSLAIGRKGQNVRLAAKLSGWSLDIVSEADIASRTAEAIFNLMLMPNMTETMAQNIFQSGFASFQAIAEADVASLALIPGYEEDGKAQSLVEDAKVLVKKYENEPVPVPIAAKESKVKSGGGGDAKSQAEALLQAEMEQLKTTEEEGRVEEVEEPEPEEGEEEAVSELEVEEPEPEEGEEEAVSEPEVEEPEPEEGEEEAVSEPVSVERESSPASSESDDGGEELVE